MHIYGIMLYIYAKKALTLNERKMAFSSCVKAFLWGLISLCCGQKCVTDTRKG